MRIRHHLLHGAQSLDAKALDGECLNLVRARGRANRLQIPAGWTSTCVVLGGSLELHSQDADWALPRWRYQVWLDGSLRCASHGQGWWLVLAGPARAWDAETRAWAMEMLPWDAPCTRAILRPLVRLGRRGELDRSTAAGIVADLGQAIVDHQETLYAHLQRCSGRTRLRRQQTLVRLLRVQHLIRCHLDDHVSLARLAASANYSPCHLIRVYRTVFGETPNEYAARLRAERAWELVCRTPMPVCQIAGALGFESESAFCRAFKHAFGCTTSSVRRGYPSAAAARLTAGGASAPGARPG